MISVRFLASLIHARSLVIMACYLEKCFQRISIAKCAVVKTDQSSQLPYISWHRMPPVASGLCSCPEADPTALLLSGVETFR